jgi:hypothetical protein
MRRRIELAGTLLACAALVYVGHLVLVNWTEIARWRMPPGYVVDMAGLGLILAMCGFLLSTAWHLLLRVCQPKPVRLAWSHRVYGATQVAKYLPGNVFHFAGRHLLGRGAGLGHRALLVSTLMETTLLVLAAFVLIALGGHLGRIFNTANVLLAGGALVMAVVVVAWGRRPAQDLWRGVVDAMRVHAWRIVAVLALYTGFFVVTGLVFVQLVALVSGQEWPDDSPRYVSIFALAWLAGFVTPGAPAGIGVRETLLVASLGPDVQAHQALIVVASMRATTLIGDLGFFLATWPLPRDAAVRE